MKRLRSYVAERLLFVSGRIDPDMAFRKSSVSFYFQDHVGIVPNIEGLGCPLWYRGRLNYGLAHQVDSRTEQDQ